MWKKTMKVLAAAGIISIVMSSMVPAQEIDWDEDPAEAAALSAVYNEYKGQVCTGAGDEEVYQAFVDKLYANGMQKYIDDVQAQLDAWLAEQ